MDHVSFIVLAKADGSDRTLVAADQRAAAEAHGFTEAEFTVDAPTRAAARRAWDGQRRPPGAPPLDPPAPDDHGLEALTESQRAAVVDLVRAIAAHDRDALAAAGAFDDPDGDPYRWTAPYGRWGRVDVVAPPGDPRHWAGAVIRGEAGEPLQVVIDLWTAQEGPSDLSLEVELDVGPDGTVSARFVGLHVL